MKLVEARQALNKHMDILDVKRSHIRTLLKEQEKTGVGDFDRVELSKELEVLDKAYEEAFQERERVNEIGSAIHNAEVSKQQAEAEMEANKEMMKYLEIFRRIANGDQVPALDEQKLMEYDSKMYMVAKNMALMHLGEKKEKHDSLWGDEEEKGESPDPVEMAENAEVDISIPELSTGTTE